jgi:hypothetical protein
MTAAKVANHAANYVGYTLTTELRYPLRGAGHGAGLSTDLGAATHYPDDARPVAEAVTSGSNANALTLGAKFTAIPSAENLTRHQPSVEKLAAMEGS